VTRELLVALVMLLAAALLALEVPLGVNTPVFRTEVPLLLLLLLAVAIHFISRYFSCRSLLTHLSLSLHLRYPPCLLYTVTRSLFQQPANTKQQIQSTYHHAQDGSCCRKLGCSRETVVNIEISTW